MSVSEKPNLLIAEIEKGLNQIKLLEDYYQQLKQDSVAFPKGKRYELVILADIFADYYTCLETVFLRISKFFENHLETTQWHTQLLEKVTLEIPNIRKRIIRDETFNALKEILRFRHFKRYYFEFEYDKDRIEFLEKKFIQSKDLVVEDLIQYQTFLSKLAKQ